MKWVFVAPFEYQSTILMVLDGEKGSQHIKAIHRKRSFICVKFATNGFLRKEVSTSRQSTEREAFTSGQGQATRKLSFICVKFATDGFLRKEGSTSRQSTEREAFTSGQGQATRK